MEKNKETIKNENMVANNLVQNKNAENSQDDLFFYVMTLQTDKGEKQEIKIYENSNASELAFNFCKIYNLDFSTMKYLKKCIKQIIQQFKNNKNKEIVYFLKDNNSIQEVAEEEIITDNSLKKSGTMKQSNANNNNQNQSKETVNNINDINISISNINKSINLSKKNKDKDKNDNNSNNGLLNDIKKDEIKINEYDIIKSNKGIEDEIEEKEYSIDCQLDNDSLEIFAPTEHTTKIEQRSSLRNNSSSLTKGSRYDKYFFDKKNFSKNKKIQINGNKSKSISSNKTFNKKSFSSNYQKMKKESNFINTKNIINEFNIIKNKKSFTKKNSLNLNSHNNNIANKKPQSVEKYKKKINNRTPLLELSQNNRKLEAMKQNRKKYKNNYDKFMTNMNEMKNKYFSNYYNYFLKSKNISNTLSRNSIIQKYQYQTSSSINQDTNKSKSISQKKINKNLAQKSLYRALIKKEKDKEKDKSISDVNSQNSKNMNNSSKINLSSLLKKDKNSHSKDKQRIILKKKMKEKYNITYANNALLNRNKNNKMNKRNYSWKRKEGSKEKETYFQRNKYSIKKMGTVSLSNIHKLKDSQEKKHSIVTDRVIKEMQTKNKNIKNRELFNKLFRNEPNDESIKNINNINDKLYNEFRNKQKNNNLNHKNNRNNTDINFTQNKNSIRNECKGSILTFYKHN